MCLMCSTWFHAGRFASIGLICIFVAGTPVSAQTITIVGTQHLAGLDTPPTSGQLAYGDQSRRPPEPDLQPLEPGRAAELSLTDGLWFKGPLGWIGAETTCQASHAAAEMRAAESAFTAHFQAPSVSIAVVARSLAQHADSLGAAGMAAVMPWLLDCPSSAERASTAPSGLRRPASEDGAAQATILRHELGHLLFIYGLWPGSGADSEYGGGAPDWLDEAAAIAVEGDATTAGRRAAFATLVARDDLIGLDEYFTMPHPRMANTRLQALLEEMRDRVEAGEENVVMQADPAVVRGDRMAEFYAQGRGLIDFLIERSGNPRILMSITRALRDGQSVDEWLAEAGDASGLSSNIEELDRRFRAWAEQRLHAEARDARPGR